jgi:hypothetical protein
MSSERIDHAVEARSRVATQYTASYKFLSALAKLAARCQEVEDVLLQVKEITDIDNARGVNLDVIGDIVGVSREIPNAVALQFFGFSDTTGASTFGEEGSNAIGARFYEEKEAYTATTTLGDPELRLLIRAKIIKNHAIGTCEDILTGMGYIFQGAINVIEDVGGMRISIGVGRQLSYVEKLLIRQLDLLPRPNGVRISALVSFEAESYLGFQGQPGAVGFAEEGSLVGGLLAEEF